MKNVRHAVGFLAGFFQPVAVAEHAAPRQCKETKGEARLSARLKDHAETVNAAHNRGKDMSGYRTPGSVQ